MPLTLSKDVSSYSLKNNVQNSAFLLRRHWNICYTWNMQVNYITPNKFMYVQQNSIICLSKYKSQSITQTEKIKKKKQKNKQKGNDKETKISHNWLHIAYICIFPLSNAQSSILIIHNDIGTT